LFENVSSVFVPHSRVFIVAEFLKKENLKDVVVVGYDLLDKNKTYLNEGFIDFLINQKPDVQGFLGIEYLYKNIVLKEKPDLVNFVPIEIIVKESL
jgi:LacI family transcriptional regulator